MIDPVSSTQQPQEQHQTGGAQAESGPAQAAQQRYQIRRELGRGFSSIVYEALDTVRARTVALKVLTLGQALSDERRQDMAERFLREARAISALSHPNIVSIYEVGQAGDGRHFIAMELLAGESLRARLDREAPLGAEDAVPIALQVAEALEYAHARGIVHRDVKPDNIYVLPDGRVKLMDFGVAHILSEGALTQTGTVVGSPAYMSPEQISGLPLSGSSDVFSLGVTLAEMLTGHKPFDAPSIPAVMNRILHRPPQIDGVQPRGLRKVVEKALAKVQASRYPNASAFAEALRRQGVSGSAGRLSTETIIMPSPLPRPRPAAVLESPGLSDLPQEPPSRAALWTFGVAGLALLACAPFALSHLSLSSAPTASASVRALPAGSRQVAEAPAAQVAHIPAAWGRQPARMHVLSRRRARPFHAAPVATKPAVLSAPVVAVVAARSHFVPPAIAPYPVAVRSAAAAPPAVSHPIAAAHSRPVLVASAVPTAAAKPAALVSALAARHQARVNAMAAEHQAAAQANAAARQARVAMLSARHAATQPAHHAGTVVAHAALHAPSTRIAAALPATSLAAGRIAARPVVVRVGASREEQRLAPPAPPVHATPSFVAALPRPVSVPNAAPRLLRRAAAEYPASLRAGGIGGTVLVRLSVSAQGRVTEATVLQSSGTDDLDAAALDSVGQWFYEPAYQDGKAVAAQITARIDFRP